MTHRNSIRAIGADQHFQRPSLHLSVELFSHGLCEFIRGTLIMRPRSLAGFTTESMTWSRSDVVAAAIRPETMGCFSFIFPLGLPLGVGLLWNYQVQPG